MIKWDEVLNRRELAITFAQRTEIRHVLERVIQLHTLDELGQGVEVLLDFIPLSKAWESILFEANTDGWQLEKIDRSDGQCHVTIFPKE